MLNVLYDNIVMKGNGKMYKILRRKELNPTVTLLDIEAPLIAKKAEPGQFIILRVDEEGERMPLTIADYDREAGWVRIIFQIVGGTTEKLNHLMEGDYIQDFVGPLGVPTHVEGLKKVAVVGGGVGCAIAFPIAKKLHEMGAEVHSVVGFRNKKYIKKFNFPNKKELKFTLQDFLIESCASGGGRFDCGMLYYTPQIWTSDNTDAVERASIQYGTSFIYPMSCQSAHVSICPNHQTKRTVSINARHTFALTGSFGYELDLNKVSEQDKENIKDFIKFYNEKQS